MATSEAFVRRGDNDWTPTDPGVRRRIQTYNDDLMVVEFEFQKDAVGKLHQHPHVQSSYVAEGSFEVTIDGKTEVLSKGQSFIVASNLVHGVKALEPGLLLDTFVPAREEFL
ncbi:MAG TPA: cupin domain-containing protein [Rhizobiaceae bacterium]|nr:cupin domain-containing protein [Rhizobiaceae bacterium]